MALTGKTIGELEYLQFPTNDTLLPVQYIGDTFHISFSSITYNEGTYAQFVSESIAGILTPGRFYLMTDFQTCYDQPNYTNEGVAITTGNYKTGSTEPILLLAISTTEFSPTVYSTIYINDKITYDFTWDTTEVTISPAKGRITERIDRFNNRADYDFRAVQFIRYQAFLSENYYNGTVSIDGSGKDSQADSVFGITETANQASGGLYGAGRFGYTINDDATAAISTKAAAPTSTAMVTASISAADFNYDTAWSASTAGGVFQKLTFSTASFTRPDLEGVRAFTISGTNILAAYPQFTAVNSNDSQISFVVKVTSATGATDAERMFFDNALNTYRNVAQERAGITHKFKQHIAEIETQYHPDKLGEFVKLWPELANV